MLKRTRSDFLQSKEMPLFLAYQPRLYQDFAYVMVFGALCSVQLPCQLLTLSFCGFWQELPDNLGA